MPENECPPDCTASDKTLERLVKRDAMMDCVDALQKLTRDDRIQVLKCVRQFYGLPIVD
jgi:hypothetical protein